MYIQALTAYGMKLRLGQSSPGLMNVFKILFLAVTSIAFLNLSASSVCEGSR